MRVAYSSITRWQSETQNCAMGICGLHRGGLLGYSWLAYSNIRGSFLVGSRSFDMSDCARQLGFSLRSQVVLGSCCEPSHICADRPNGGSSAGISKSVSRSGAVTVAKSRVHVYTHNAQRLKSPVGVEKVTEISRLNGGKSVVEEGELPRHALLDHHSRRRANHDGAT